MPNKAIQHLILSQVSFFIFISLCILLIPSFLFASNEGGISNYGVHYLTVIPFSIAFFLSGFFVFRAAQCIPKSSNRLKQLGYILYTLAVLSLLVLLSTYPYKVNKSFTRLHLLIGLIVFFFESITAIWLSLRLQKNLWNIVLLTIQALGFILGVLTLMGTVRLLFIVQLVTTFSFGFLLIRYTDQIT